MPRIVILRDLGALFLLAPALGHTYVEGELDVKCSIARAEPAPETPASQQSCCIVSGDPKLDMQRAHSITSSARVDMVGGSALDEHFEPIRGLCAAGEVAGMAGGHINGRAGLEGTMLGPSIFSGRVAGGWAAQAAGHGGGFVGKPNRS